MQPEVRELLEHRCVSAHIRYYLMRSKQGREWKLNKNDYFIKMDSQEEVVHGFGH